MKICFKCGESKPLEDFYRHSALDDGHLGKCKECTKRDAATRYRQKRNDPAWMAQERARGREKAARLSSSGRVWVAPDAPFAVKRAANGKVKHALRMGKLVKPEECARCERKGPVQGHHTDYSDPLNVVWLCPKCHRVMHYIHRSEVA